MKTNERRPRRLALVLTIATMLAMTAGSALAAIPSTTAYLNALQPMVTGKVVNVNEHQLVVETEQDEDVVLALDSRSMVPVDLAPGMAARVEFKMLDDGRRYVKRVIPIRSGMDANRELAYSTERGGGEAETHYASTSEGERGDYRPSRASTAPSSTNQSLGTSLAATPATDAYLVAMQPMIAGRVVSVNDHRIVVDTDQGQRVRLDMDSRTMVPVNLASGSTVRIDYRSMEDGPKYAKRITLINSDANTSPEMSYVQPPERQEAEAEVAPAEAAPAAEPAPASAPEPESLPQTASNQPLIALLGFLSIGVAGAMAIGRRLHTG